MLVAQAASLELGPLPLGTEAAYPPVNPRWRQTTAASWSPKRVLVIAAQLFLLSISTRPPLSKGPPTRRTQSAHGRTWQQAMAVGNKSKGALGAQHCKVSNPKRLPKQHQSPERAACTAVVQSCWLPQQCCYPPFRNRPWHGWVLPAVCTRHRSRGSTMPLRHALSSA